MKHFTKTLLAGAIALAATGAAEARIADTAQPVTFMGSEMVLTVWNVTTQKSYTLDLGVTQSQFLAGHFAGLNRAVADVNLTSLLQASAATDDIRYSVTSGSSSTSSSNVLVASGDYAGLSKKVASLTNYGLIVSGQQGALADFTAVTSTSAKVNTAIISEANNASNVNSATGQAAASDAVNVSLFASLGDQGYAGDATWGANLGGALGAFSTMAAVGTNMSLFRASLNPGNPALLVFNEFDKSLNFSVAGLGSANAAGTLSFINVSAVPLPAAVWMFGAGLMGLLGLNRRKAVAV